MLKVLKEKITSITSGTSGTLSLLGGYNVCHNICLAAIAGLALIGISVQGMPFAFLQDFSIPLWSLGVGLLGVTGFLYVKKKCVSKNLLAANSGLLIAAIPFREFEFMQMSFWIIGFGLVGVAVYNYVDSKRKKDVKECCHTKMQ